MALNVAGLQASILTILQTPEAKTTPQLAAAEWTNAYDTYGLGATDASFDPVVLANRAGFQSALQFVAPGTAAAAAQEFETAFLAYWTGATFAIAISPTPAAICPSIPPAPPWLFEITSIVSTVTPGLAAQLLPIFQDNANPDLVSRASQLATAFHTATTTNVLVTISGTTVPIPPAPVGVPVINICTIF